MDSEHPLHYGLVARFAQAPDFNSKGASASESLFYSEADLQMHLYQLTLVRFHCSVRGEVISASAETPKTPAPMSPAGNFSLTNHNGEFVTDKTYRGRYMLVYFGFTGCSEACPVSLNSMASALNDLDGTMADQIQPLFISLDPRNDTVDHLSKYVKMFHPRLQGLTGTEAEVRRAARGYSAFYYAGEVDGTYLENHTGYIYLVDSEGRHIAHFEPGENPGKITAVLKQHINSIVVAE
jgi:cytochrome oxidase Cu insertion factor (SCO1/SenC/PrrC family)